MINVLLYLIRYIFNDMGATQEPLSTQAYLLYTFVITYYTSVLLS